MYPLSGNSYIFCTDALLLIKLKELFKTCKENSLTTTNKPTDIINNCNNLSLIFIIEK